MTIKRASKPVAGKKVPWRNGKNWLMAFDPYVDFDTGPMKETAARLAAASKADVIAAYVLAPASLNWSGDFNGPWLARYKPVVAEKMREEFEGTEFHPTVIPCREPGLNASVKKLVQFARKVKSEAIVISSHARHGIERLALGSFAETLILTSPVPVLVTKPDYRPPEKIRRILVPTDLTRNSEKYVSLNGVWAKRLGAEVVLYHKQSDPLDPVIQQGVYTLGGGWVSVQNFIDEEIGIKQKMLEKMAKSLSNKGLTVSTVLDQADRGLVGGILATAQDKGCDLICVWTHSGRISAAVLGSVARGLVRESRVPVLVRR